MPQARKPDVPPDAGDAGTRTPDTHDAHPVPPLAGSAAQRTGSVVGFDPQQLDGFRIGVTSDRRSDDLIAALERRGAEVLHAPTLRIVPAQQDHRLIDDTGRSSMPGPTCYWRPPPTGCAAGSRRRTRPVSGRACRGARRGPDPGPRAQGSGALRAAGLSDQGMSAEETTSSLVDQVIADGAAGRTVAVQLHGFVDDEQLQRLRDAARR